MSQRDGLLRSFGWQAKPAFFRIVIITTGSAENQHHPGISLLVALCTCSKQNVSYYDHCILFLVLLLLLLVLLICSGAAVHIV